MARMTPTPSRPEGPDRSWCSSSQLHDELLRLTRGLGGFRLAIADGFERLVAKGGVEWLGLPNADAYARERLGRSGRWLGDARTLGRRLARLPQLREAYLSGQLSTSKVELLARHLVRDEASIDEHQAIALATSMTVRQLRAELAESLHEAGDHATRKVRLARHVDRVDALAFEGAIRLMEAIGEPTRAAAIEGLLAEGLTTLLNRADLAPDLVNDIAFAVPSEPDSHETGSPADVGTDGLGAPEAPTRIRIEPPYIDPSVEDVPGLDLELRALSAELTRRDLRIGELALEAERRGLPSAHGHRTVDSYYMDELGVAPSSVAARMALARRVDRLPRLRAAIESGAIGFESATLLARIASPRTESAWLALADISTTKIFREHVDAAELHARVQGLALDGLEPPSCEQLEDARDLERHVLAQVVSGDTEPGGEPDPGPMSVPFESPPEEDDLGCVPLRLTLPEDLASFWTRLEVLHVDAGFPSGSFVAFLVAATLQTWRGRHRAPAYGDIYLRDRYRCQSPVCRSRHVTPHHIVFRSRGGGDEPTNLVALCDRCHLTLVHGGHLAVTGLAPCGLTWASRGFIAYST